MVTNRQSLLTRHTLQRSMSHGYQSEISQSNTAACCKCLGLHAGEAGRVRSAKMLRALQSNPRLANRTLIMANLYARIDATTLQNLRKNLQRLAWVSALSPLSAPAACTSAAAMILGVAGAVVLSDALFGQASSSGGRNRGGGGVLSDTYARCSDAFSRRQESLAGAGAVATTVLGGGLYLQARHTRHKRIGAALQQNVRIVRARPTEELARVLDSCISAKDSVDRVRCAYMRACLPSCTTSCSRRSELRPWTCAGPMPLTRVTGM